MYPLSSKKRLRILSILFSTTYLILCMTAGGFHSFDKSAYHDHYIDNHHSEDSVIATSEAGNSTPTLCCNDHREETCIICKWLKGTSKKVLLTPVVSRFWPYTSESCINDQEAYYFLSSGSYHTRSPPLITS